ncbi:MAG: hypothetical protein K6E40_01850 [Desulfovibrio sp.]|nr:hypothetical protein [Desulfovibrio sp.]
MPTPRTLSAARRLACLLWLLALLALPLSCGEALAAESDTFIRSVVLIKEGVRAPSESEIRLQRLDKAHTWTDWPVGAGRVTRRGKDLVRALWSAVGQALRDDGLFPQEGCPKPGLIYMRVDAMPRSLDTASAVLEGVLPGCHEGYWARPEGLADPLFHALRAGYCPLRPQETASDIIQSLPDKSLDALTDSLSGELDVLDSLLAPLNKNLCERYSLPNCRVSEMATNVTVMPRGAGAFLSGGLGMAAGLADIFLMEAYQGSFSAVGAKTGDKNLLAKLWSLRTAARNPVNRSQVVSSASASGMLKAMVDALFGRLPDKRARDARFVIFVGHDLCMGQTAGLAGLHWSIPGIAAQNPTLPGCGLTFELWRRPDGSQYVVSHLLANEPETLHTLELHGDDGTLKPVRVMALDVRGEDGLPFNMDDKTFETTMLSRIRGECVPPEPEDLRYCYPAPESEGVKGAAAGKEHRSPRPPELVPDMIPDTPSDTSPDTPED